MVMNGYYDKEALGLKGAFKPHTNNAIGAVDERLFNQNENFNFANQNKVY